MATVKISALPEITSTATDDVIAIVDTSAGTTNKIQVSNLPDTDTTYSTATTSTEGLVKLEDGTAQTVAANTVTTTASRTYGVQLNGTGQAVVNVPWVDTDTDTDTTYSTATASALGLVKIEDDTDQSVAANAVTTTASRTYGVQLNSSDQAVVNVPWTDTDTDTQLTNEQVQDIVGAMLTGNTETNITVTYQDADGTIDFVSTDTDTTYSIATDSTAGIIKLEDNTDQTTAANAITTTASRTYGIQLNSSDQAVVNVPWTAGASATRGFYEHPKTITSAETITTDYNAVTAGPITYGVGGSITVPSGSTWIIL
jgi:hypothetical protein